jgi:hypothetical protein
LIDVDEFIKINSEEYKIIMKPTIVKPTMTVIVSLPDVNIPKPKEIDDGKVTILKIKNMYSSAAKKTTT